MVNRKALLVFAVVVTVLLILFYPTRERQVKKRIKALREWSRVEGPEPSTVQLGKYRGVLELIDDPVEFESTRHDVSRTVPAQEAAQQAVGWRSNFESLQVDIADLHISFPEDQQANVTATVRISGAMRGGDRIEETHELHALLRKRDQGWRFSRFELFQVLEK